jgi:hypothetical protein
MATSKEVLASIAIRIGIDSASMSKSLNKINSDMNVFKSGLKTLGKAIAAAFAFDRLVDFGKSSFNSYLESEKNVVKLTTALKGNVKQLKELQEVANRQQSITIFSDEESMNAMTRMRSILGDNMEAIKRLLPLIQDFATVKEMGLAEAADMVSRSIASSTNALKRQGIEITGAAGSSERLESAVTALTRAFGGQAKALGDTLYGQLIKTKNAWDNIKEAIGAVVSPVVSNSAKAWQYWAEVMMSNVSAWEKWKTTFTSVSGLVDKYNEKYQTLGDNLERIQKIGQIKMNPDGSFIMQPGQLTGTIPQPAKPVGTPKPFTPVDVPEPLVQGWYDNPESLSATAGSDITSLPMEGIRAKWDAIAEANREMYLQMEEDTKQFTQAMEFMLEDFVITFAESFGEMIATGKNANWGQLLTPIADAMSSLGKLIIVAAIALDKIKENLRDWATVNKGAAIIAGVALIAVASAVKAGISNIASGGGGGASMPSASNTSGDSIINRNLGDAEPIRVEVTGTLRGDVIRLANKRAEEKHTYGY